MLLSDRNQTNATSNQSNPASSIIPYVALEVIIAVFALLNNTLVLHAVWKFKKLHTTPYKLVASLAVADIAVALVAIPSGIVLRFDFPISSQHKEDMGGPELSYTLCSILASVVLILTQVSIFNLLIIAIDRFLAIEYSLRYNAIVTSQRVRFAIAGTWVCGVVFAVVPHLGWESAQQRVTTSDNSTLVCGFEAVISMEFMVYVNFFGCVLLPLIVMFVLYYFIFKSAREQLKKIYADVLFYKKQNRRSSLSSLKSMKDMFIVRKRQEKPKKTKLSLRTKMLLTKNGKKEHSKCKCEANRNVIYDISSTAQKHDDVTSKTDRMSYKYTNNKRAIVIKQGNESSLTSPASKTTRSCSVIKNSIIVETSAVSSDDETSSSESHEISDDDPKKGTNPTEPSSCNVLKSSTLSRDEIPPINSHLSRANVSLPGDNQRKISCASSASSVPSTVGGENCKIQKILRRRSRYLKKESHAARSLFIVLGAFVLCWMPLHVCNFITLFGPSIRINLIALLDCTILLSHANSLINPIIYAFQLSDMKEAFKKLLKQYWATLAACMCCCSTKVKQAA